MVVNCRQNVIFTAHFQKIFLTYFTFQDLSQCLSSHAPQPIQLKNVNFLRIFSFSCFDMPKIFRRNIIINGGTIYGQQMERHAEHTQWKKNEEEEKNVTQMINCTRKMHCKHTKWLGYLWKIYAIAFIFRVVVFFVQLSYCNKTKWANQQQKSPFETLGHLS